MPHEAILRRRPDLLSGDDFARFAALVRRACGLIIPEARRRDLDRVVADALDQHGLPDADALHDHLTAGSGRTALEAFVGALTVGETHFFRNRPQFRALENFILPELIAHRSTVGRLRVWSAGCSSGEEAYSLAMLIHKLIPNFGDWNVTILATDISSRALDRAKRAVYGSWSFREAPEEMVRRYFLPRGDQFEVVPAIRSLVTFGYLNLIEDAYPSLPTKTVGMDLILCRNVLLYFDAATARKVAGRLFRSLDDGGSLLVAPAELSSDVFADFELRNVSDTVVSSKAPNPPDELAVPPVPEVPVSAAATEAARGAPVKSPEAGAQEAYAAARAAAGRLEFAEAERLVSVTLERDPLMAKAHYLRGLIRLEEGDEDAALAALRRCVFSDPAFALGHFMLGGLFARAGESARSHKSLDAAASLLSDVDPNEVIDEGDGLTAGRVLELVGLQKEMVGVEVVPS
jgi:chemotaxis protein methyltransferase CheR